MLVTGRHNAGSFKGIGSHSAVPLWTSMSAAFMAIVLSISVEFQLSSLWYSGANYHHPHEKQHQEIVPFLFLLITCPPAAIIVWDVTCNQGKVDSFMINSCGSSVNQSVTVSGRGKVASCRTEFLLPIGTRKFSFRKSCPDKPRYGSPLLVRRIGSILLWGGIQWDLGTLSQQN